MSGQPRSISRDEINALPVRRWQGEVHVVATAEEAARALAGIREETVIGFDTETRPAFRPGESYPPSLAQLATARAVYLFQVRHREVAAAVAEVLAAEPIVKAGVGLADDLKALKKVIEFAEKSTVDLGAAAARHGMKQTGVRSLAAIFLGFRVPKGTKTSNWARPRLTPQQVAYAATDAWACRELYVRFRTLGWV
ncbi:MAG TPA: 3'-5' exonuclease [Burkholderiales bacterium]|nr:3'-5' exonuclease [Burkholderiales bacterium]